MMDTLRATDIRKDSDGALVTAAKCGDTDAFGELVARYKREFLNGAADSPRSQDSKRRSFSATSKNGRPKKRLSFWVPQLAQLRRAYFKAAENYVGP